MDSTFRKSVVSSMVNKFQKMALAPTDEWDYSTSTPDPFWFIKYETDLKTWGRLKLIPDPVWGVWVEPIDKTETNVYSKALPNHYHLKIGEHHLVSTWIYYLFTAPNAIFSEENMAVLDAVTLHGDYQMTRDIWRAKDYILCIRSKLEKCKYRLTLTVIEDSTIKAVARQALSLLATELPRVFEKYWKRINRQREGNIHVFHVPFVTLRGDWELDQCLDVNLHDAAKFAGLPTKLVYPPKSKSGFVFTLTSSYNFLRRTVDVIDEGINRRTGAWK